VKILDFGLAKLVDPQANEESSTHSLSLIGKGILLGTASYMAPEQAMGKPVGNVRTYMRSAPCCTR